MPTNAMPRNNTLSEDREALSNLVRNPTVSSPTNSLNMSPRKNTPRSNNTKKSLAKSPFESINGMPSMPSLTPPAASPTPSSKASAISSSPLASAPPSASPWTASSATPSSNKVLNQVRKNSIGSEELPRTVSTMKMNSTSKQMGNAASRQVLTSNPPDIGSDLVSSQTQSPTPTAALVQEPRGGTMLEAIKQKTESLKSMLKLRKSSTRKNN